MQATSVEGLVHVHNVLCTYQPASVLYIGCWEWNGICTSFECVYTKGQLGRWDKVVCVNHRGRKDGTRQHSIDFKAIALRTYGRLKS